MCETSALAMKRTHKEATRNHYTCIADRRVPPRAQASLPAVLQLVSGRVLTRRALPSNTRFGPVQGIGRELTAEEAARLARAASDQRHPLFLLTDPVHRTAVHLDLSDENTSNWFHYVGAAQPREANLRLKQWGSELYAVAPRPLKPRTVLSLPSSYSYIASVLLPDDNNMCAGSGGEGEHIDADCVAWDEGWRCHECGHLCHTSAELQRHVLMQHAQEESANYETERRVRRRRKKLSCLHCSRFFTRLFCLERHMKTHQRKILQDSLPSAVNENRIYDDTDVLHDYVESKVTDTHSLCTKITSNNLTPIDYLQDFTHSDMGPEYVSTRFSDGTLDPTDCMHERVGGEKRRRLACVLCAGVATTRREHHQHTQAHRQSNGLFYCPHCNKTYGAYVSVLKHIRSKHAPPRYVCLHCKLTFTQSSACVSHLITHTDVKQFACECGKAFKRKQKLKEHMTRKHPNGCERTEVPVKQIDLSGMPFVCRLCQIGFKRRGMLVNHLTRCHPEQSTSSVPELARPITRVARDYPCTHCTRVYRSQTKRKKHFHTHHPGEPLPTSVSAWSHARAPLTCAPQHCPASTCRRQYSTRSRLNRHIRDAHPHLVPAILMQEQLVEPIVTKADPDPAPTEQQSVYTEKTPVYTQEPPVYTKEPPVYAEVVTPTAATILFLAADQHALLCQQGEETVTLALEVLPAVETTGADTYAAEALTYLQFPPPPYHSSYTTPPSTGTGYISSTDNASQRSVNISRSPHSRKKYKISAKLTTEGSADT